MPLAVRAPAAAQPNQAMALSVSRSTTAAMAATSHNAVAVSREGPVRNRRGLIAYLILQTPEEGIRMEEVKGAAKGWRRTASERGEG